MTVYSVRELTATGLKGVKMGENQYLCPACVRPLTQRPGPNGVFWECEGCSRQLISLATLRKTTNFTFVSQLRQDARVDQPGRGGQCPVCKIPMGVVTREAGALCFQICVFCEMIWLGPAERASLPAPPPVSEEPLPEKAAELIARLDSRFPSQTSSRQAPSRPAEALLWFLGIPPKPGGEDWVRFPWMTLLLVIVVIGFNGLSSYLIGSMFPTWQWNPSLWPGGARSSLMPLFFIQGGFLNLGFSAYLLFLAGTSVENKLGPLHLLALFVLPNLLGDAVSFALDTHSGWITGVNGGVTAVLVFYLFAFPRKKILWRYADVQAGYVILTWFVFEVYCGFNVNRWFSSAVYSAHLGGALCGWAYWFFLRKKLGLERNRDEGLLV